MEAVPENADAVADRLYAMPPRQFVAERDAATAAAREAGDTATAAALAKLRRPTVSAWLVNLLALRRPELLAELADLATALREAQRDLDGAQLRELTAQRRAAVSALVAEARSLALEVEPADAKLPLGEVESTLVAALADPEAAAAVRSGRLLRAVTADGFGELPRARLRLVEGGGGADATDSTEAAAPSREEIETELAAARTAAAEADAELDRITATQTEAKQALADLDAQLAELTARRSAALNRVAEAEAAGLVARRAVAAARRRVGAAEGALADPDLPPSG